MREGREKRRKANRALPPPFMLYCHFAIDSATPTNVATVLQAPADYGAFRGGFQFGLAKGYSTLAGRNNSGKSTLLQLVFKLLYAPGSISRDSICLIPQDRQYAHPTTQPPTTLLEYNNKLYSLCDGQPIRYDSARLNNLVSLYTLLLHRTDLIRQFNDLNKFLLRMGFDPVALKDAQTVRISDIEIAFHGSGIRCTLPILAALTSPDIKYLLIDEPELSLEARAQKVLKELLLEASSDGKTILIATQSHIFLNKADVGRNYVLNNRSGQIEVNKLTSKDELLNLTFNLLGNSLEDLFSPSNFLIVEGSSDQVICERVCTLLEVPAGKVKVISAQGIDNVGDSYRAIKNTLIPLITDHSPYAQRVVVLVDNPTPEASSKVKELQSTIGNRCVVLDQPSIEEYIPEHLYKLAGRDKGRDLNELCERKKEHAYAKKDDTLRALRELKRKISSSLASSLTIEHLNEIPQIRDAVKLAAEKATS